MNGSPEWIVGGILWLAQVVISIALSIAVIYIGINFLKRLINIDFFQELRRGNKAVSYLILGMMIAIAIVVASGIGGLTSVILRGFSPDNTAEFFRALVVGLMQLIGGLILSIIAIYIAITGWNKITKNIDELKELQRGNQAVGLVMAGIMIAVAIVIQAGIVGLTGVIGG